MVTFQEILRRLSTFWEQQGCIVHQGYDQEVGAGTFNPATFLRCLGPEPYNAAYVEPCRRPSDGRYGENPNRLQHYFQYQTILKPSPPNIQDLYLKSLEAIGFDLSQHDIRFVHDDWESPTLGAWGLGWEVWMDGMEVTQFTYFQSFGGFTLKPITGEITYGIERLAMYLQEVDSVYDLQWSEHLKYGDIYHRNEVEWSHYNFEVASTEMWFRHFDDFEAEAKRVIEAELPIPAYDFVMKASHAFNMLDARGVISVTERARYIARVRDLACGIASSYLTSREQQGFPLLEKEHYTPTIIPTAPSLPEKLKAFSPEVKKDFLLEIGSEELPATFVPIGCRNLEKSLRQLLKKEEIAFDNISIYGTPRRLAARIEGLAAGKPAQTTERRGPAVKQAFDDDGNPKPAAQGFFRSINMEAPSLSSIRSGEFSAISIREVKNAEYLFVNVEKPGVATATLLKEQLPSLILGLDFPKKMRWSDLEIAYARPIKWILCLFGEEVILFVVGNILSGKETQGHPQLSPGMFSINSPEDYKQALLERKVMVDTQERRNTIITQIDAIEKELNVKVISRDDVIPQVLNLVEWPQATTATFDEQFLKVPKEVAISEMVEHQKYFPVANENGSLINQFVITADTVPTDKIRHGNQNVLSARLSDGVFLYEKGLNVPLDKLNQKLKTMTFQKGLGTVYNKMERLVQHAEHLQQALSISTPEKVRRAATLCKADLASEMVFEFPELQGTIGQYYALAQGEDPEVATAIEEHWMPRGEKEPLPHSETGIILSLADKIDNLLSCFGSGLKPTSSSDPHALRRQMLGIIRILLDNKVHLPIIDTFQTCLKHFPEQFQQNKTEILNDLAEFIINRIKTVFQDYNLKKDEIEASLSTQIEDIYDTFNKTQALNNFRNSNSEFPQLYEVYKRAKGQLTNHKAITFCKDLLQEPAEIQLDNTLIDTQNDFQDALTTHNYDKAYSLIAKIQPEIATLFDEVKILADDENIRNNRIALLQRVFGLFNQLLDFSKIQEKR